jgi:phytoene synthase
VPVTASRLAEAYGRSRELHRRHGRSYYLATRILPAWKRRHVHALYGFTRYADDIVDDPDGATPVERARRLDEWAATFLAGLRGADVDDPLLPAVLHTIAVWRLDTRDFDKFLRSMSMDLSVTGYPTYDDLLEYMEGSAAVIGTMMLPILEPTDLSAAREPARQLGIAFQLTNFIRDVREDLDRGRIYLPEKDLGRFGVTRETLVDAVASGVTPPEVIALVRYEVDRARAHYAAAVPGIALLRGASRACIRTAYRVYGGILDEVVRARYDVLPHRVSVPPLRRLGLAARGVSGGRPGLPGDPAAGSRGRWRAAG